MESLPRAITSSIRAIATCMRAKETSWHAIKRFVRSMTGSSHVIEPSVHSITSFTLSITIFALSITIFARSIESSFLFDIDLLRHNAPSDHSHTAVACSDRCSMQQVPSAPRHAAVPTVQVVSYESVDLARRLLNEVDMSPTGPPSALPKVFDRGPVVIHDTNGTDVLDRVCDVPFAREGRRLGDDRGAQTVTDAACCGPSCCAPGASA